MADVLTPEQRHKCMTRIKGLETRPEVLVRKWLYAHNIRYRKNDKRLPGKPDIVIPNGRVVVFINGCFWHGHTGCRDFVIPKTRTQWWVEKIEATSKRDQVKSELLQELGWQVITIWECQVKRSFDSTMQILYQSIHERRAL